MRIKNLLIVLAVTVGLSIGYAASFSLDGENKCEKTEKTIKQKSNISGAYACFEPGVIEVNLSERVEENAQLECVCRRSINGNVVLEAITRANP
jgi:hypothetical protein